MSADLDDLADRLEAIADEIAELAMVRLREAIEAGASTSPEEKRLTQARRAVDKAVHLLRGASGGPASD